jgi:methanethiol S-methyltransferase
VKYILLAVLWIIFCTLHSALISITFTDFLKRKSVSLYRFHRLFYNIISIAMLVPVVIYTSSVRQEYFFIWDGYLLPVRYFLFSLGILLFILGSRHYNAAVFFGIVQIKKSVNYSLINKTGKLDTGGILGVIRHPFYAGIYPLIWSGNLDITNLIVNIILSIYVLSGTLLEERKLVLEFGDAYRDYQQKVSMLFPFKYIKAMLN